MKMRKIADSLNVCTTVFVVICFISALLYPVLQPIITPLTSLAILSGLLVAEVFFLRLWIAQIERKGPPGE
jgi:hypothetical protein